MRSSSAGVTKSGTMTAPWAKTLSVSRVMLSLLANANAPSRSLVLRRRRPMAPGWEEGLQPGGRKNGDRREAPAPEAGGRNDEREPPRTAGPSRSPAPLAGAAVCAAVSSIGAWASAGGRAVGLVVELHPVARHDEDLGREAVGVLALLAPAPGLHLALDVIRRPLVACFSSMSISPSWKVTTRCHSVLSTFWPELRSMYDSSVAMLRLATRPPVQARWLMVTSAPRRPTSSA